MRNVTGPDQHAPLLGRNSEKVRIELALLQICGFQIFRQLAERSEYRRPAILRRPDVDEAAQQTIRMDVKVVAAIGIGDVRPHIGDVVRVALDPEAIQHGCTLGEDHAGEFLHLRERLQIVGRHVGEDHAAGRRRAFAGFLDLAQLGLDAITQPAVSYTHLTLPTILLV